ncbi:hypothetical protein [Lacimicrobium alkaliphilum]|uniref:Extradiol ring-cleavage dioxygenase LigAB LigA subunit domain-containing protein n=1 Tax=Lacimicrobium alkaliphilum TaxID=1526571 RepID=A0ABQ1QYK7_9ALTE|nr:hypothetical protein [Lacimicrobium alkaliphilum]GGD51193.1 hypothetical protein GCM10011357_03880 [Lacimicrobium alkaliphilum]
MDNLSRFYLELATDANKLHAFNLSQANRQQMLEQAGIEECHDILEMDKEALRQMLAKKLIEQTGDWKGLDKASDNDDNKNNIGRLGRTVTH